MKSFEVEEEGIPFRILWHEGLASLIQVGKKGLWHLLPSLPLPKKGMTKLSEALPSSAKVLEFGRIS